MSANRPAPRVTLKRINAALAAAGFEGIELVRGAGYFYLDGPALEWPRSSIMTNGLWTMSVEEWVSAARTLERENRASRGEEVGQ